MTLENPAVSDMIFKCYKCSSGRNSQTDCWRV